jgi:hypothetical protein
LKHQIERLVRGCRKQESVELSYSLVSSVQDVNAGQWATCGPEVRRLRVAKGSLKRLSTGWRRVVSHDPSFDRLF